MEWWETSNSNNARAMLCKKIISGFIAGCNSQLNALSWKAKSEIFYRDIRRETISRLKKLHEAIFDITRVHLCIYYVY